MRLAAPARRVLARLGAATGWPSTCQVCGCWPADPLCADCLARFAPTPPRCPRCGAPQATARPAPPCAPCRARAPTPAGPETCLVAVDYGYPWDGLIARFKFRGEAGWATPFAARLLAVPAAPEAMALADWIVPVPLTAGRVAERGHHPPWELVKALHRRLPRPLCADALVRLRDGPTQHRLGRAERLTNLRGAFAVPPRRRNALAGRRVLLVDDVVTTGATLQAAALALREAGVARVDALVLARTPDRADPLP